MKDSTDKDTTIQSDDSESQRWYKHIQASRRRRDQYLDTWSAYARLHTNAYQAVADSNDDKLVELPNGDQIKAGAVHRNIEQTMALMEAPEIGIRATATDYTHELGREDSHREAVIETGVHCSMMASGFVKEAEEVDAVKRDGIVIGHGVNYSWWRIVEREVEGELLPVLQEVDGQIVPVMDDKGEPKMEREKTKQIVFSGVQDEHVSPIDFLFDASAKTLYKAAWHGDEQVVSLEDLRADPRYDVPDNITGTSYKVRNLYGVDDDAEKVYSDCVKLIRIFDKRSYKMMMFIEHPELQKSKKKDKTQDKMDLLKIGEFEWPVLFSHPDHSPYTFFVPVPANDQPFGISQIEHIRNQALEKDKLRTRQANLTRMIKRIFWHNKNRIATEDINKALQSNEAESVGIDIQDGEKASELMGEFPVPRVHPDLYRQGSMADDDVNRTSGIPEVPYTGADTATESENQMAVGGARPKRKKRLLFKFMSEVANRHRDYLRTFAPEGETIAVYGADGKPLTLPYGREAFEGKFNIEVIAGSESITVSPVKQKMMLEAAGMLMGKFTPTFDRIFTRQLLTMFDVRDVNALTQAMAQQPDVAAGLPGQAGPQADVNLNDISNGQTLRSAANAVYESNGPQ